MKREGKTRHMADPTGNPLLKRAAARGTTGHGREYEQGASKSLAARLQPASGAMAEAKGDAKRKFRRMDALIEFKSTVNQSLALQLEWLIKINEEAVAAGKQPALVFAFVDAGGKPRKLPRAQSEWVCIPRTLFEELVDGE